LAAPDILYIHDYKVVKFCRPYRKKFAHVDGLFLVRRVRRLVCFVEVKKYIHLSITAFHATAWTLFRQAGNVFNMDFAQI
jgi:hypothetical protein